MAKIVLMYHDVYKSDPAESGFRRERDYPYKVQLDRFENQVEKIVNLCRDKNISLDDVVFTFDDGGSSFLQLIAPILEKHGIKGHFYISTQYIGEDGFLNKEDIIKLRSRGHYIGSHAHSHEHLYKLSEEEVKNEWKVSCDTLSAILGEQIDEASIPNGDSSEVVLRYAKEAGLKEVYTSKPTTKEEKYKDLKLHGRYVVLNETSDDYLLSIICNKATRNKLYLKWCIIYCVKRLLGDNYVKLKNQIYRVK